MPCQPITEHSKVKPKEAYNRPFPSFFEPHYEIEVKVLILQISFHSYANKTNFHTVQKAFHLTSLS